MPAKSATAQLTRRTALQTMAAGVTLWPACLKAALTSRKPITLSVVTDTHIGYKKQESAAQQWELTAAALNEAPGNLVLHLGDVVDAGQESQYPIYLKTREMIKKPIYEIPGNHDPAELFQKYIRKTIDTTVDHDWLKIILVGNAHRDSHDGFLTLEQNAWIEEQCEAAKKSKQLVLICMHVPAHKNQHPDRGWYVKPDQGQTALYETLAKHKDRVLALWHGHFHNGIRGWEDRAALHEILFPSVLYNLDRGLEAKNAPGYNVKEFRPGYTQVTLGEGKMHLQYMPLKGAEEKPAAKELVATQLLLC